MCDVCNAWSKETSYYQDRWSPQVPSTGQCAVTALVIQDIIGGDIVMVNVPEYGSHFFNIDKNGEILDITRRQFDDVTKTQIKNMKYKKRTRKSLLKIKSTANRYAILRSRIAIGNICRSQVCNV